MHCKYFANPLYVALIIALGGCGLRTDQVESPTSLTTNAPPLARSTSGWPNFLGPSHDTTSHEKDILLDWPAAGPTALWRKVIGTGYSSPVVVDEHLILMHRVDDEEIIECFHAVDGRPRWRFAYPTSYESAYQYSNGPYSTPAIDSGNVYGWSAEGTLRCLELATGKLLWQRDLNDEYDAELGMFPVAGSVLIDDGRIILNVGGRVENSSVVALDQDTGETLWTVGSDGPGDATAVAAKIHGQHFTFMFTADGLLAVDPTCGKLRWQIPFRARATDTSNATTPVVVGDKVFMTAYKAGAICVRVLPDGRYEHLWQDRRSLMCQFHNLLTVDDCVIGFAANDHTLRCVELETGRVNWKWAAEHGRGQSLLVGDCAITIFESGHLAAIELSPREHHIRSLTADPVVSSRCFSAPAIADGRLFLRGENEIICLDLRAE